MRQSLLEEREVVVPSLTSVDMYFSADVETDGPIPGPYSMLSFAFVTAGTFDGASFRRERPARNRFYRELKPISDQFQAEAIQVNGLDRMQLIRDGIDPHVAMTEASEWVLKTAGSCRPILVAYPLSFDWSWLYWYFMKFSVLGSPFSHSNCFDLKTAFAIKSHNPISQSGRSKLLPQLQAISAHTHNALDDAIEQAEIFANIFEWSGEHDR